MTDASTRHRRVDAHRRRPLPAVVLLLATFTGACAALAWTTDYPTPARHTPYTAAVPAPVPANSTELAVPIHIDMTDIGVSAPVELLGLNGDGSLSTPKDWNSAGWYSQGVVPGEPGPAVVVGHRDSAANGPAVFYRLGELTPGDLVTVTESDGNTTSFAVQSIHQVSKSDFPTAEVYGPSEHRLLKLITCTGRFDYAAHSYEDNLVVTARAV